MSYQSQLTVEPPEDCQEPVATIRFRLPTGEMLTRRFIATNPMGMVIMFLGTKGYHTEDYKILTTYPKKDVSIASSEIFVYCTISKVLHVYFEILYELSVKLARLIKYSYTPCML